MNKINSYISGLRTEFREAKRDFKRNVNKEDKNYILALSILAGLGTFFLAGLGGFITFKALVDKYKVSKSADSIPSTSSMKRAASTVLSPSSSLPLSIKRLKKAFWSRSNGEKFEKARGIKFLESSYKKYIDAEYAGNPSSKTKSAHDKLIEAANIQGALYIGAQGDGNCGYHAFMASILISIAMDPDCWQKLGSFIKKLEKMNRKYAKLFDDFGDKKRIGDIKRGFKECIDELREVQKNQDTEKLLLLLKDAEFFPKMSSALRFFACAIDLDNFNNMDPEKIDDETIDKMVIFILSAQKDLPEATSPPKSVPDPGDEPVEPQKPEKPKEEETRQHFAKTEPSPYHQKLAQDAGVCRDFAEEKRLYQGLLRDYGEKAKKYASKKKAWDEYRSDEEQVEQYETQLDEYKEKDKEYRRQVIDKSKMEMAEELAQNALLDLSKKTAKPEQHANQQNIQNLARELGIFYWIGSIKEGEDSYSEVVFPEKTAKKPLAVVHMLCKDARHFDVLIPRQ